MINLDSITNKDNKEHNEKWPYLTDHPHRIKIIGGSGSGNTNALMNLINEQNNIDKITKINLLRFRKKLFDSYENDSNWSD